MRCMATVVMLLVQPPKETADSLLKDIQESQDSISKDMKSLARIHDGLASKASSGGIGAVYDGVSYGNQIALELNDQLAQMRALQTAQMAMAAMAQESATAEAARAKVASNKLFGFSSTPTISRPATSY